MKRLATSLVAGSALLLGALLAPVSVAAVGPVTSSACTTVGTTASCDLWAKTGTLSLPGGASTPIWGFAASSGGAASVPGPTLIVNSGDSVTVNLTNQLAVDTSILFEGQPVPPDLTGVAAGASKAYTFTAGTPGSYLYEAGLIPGSQYQAAMGLYGALIVRPAGGLLQANADASTAFDDEAIVVLGEVDPILNNLVDPSAFDLRDYAPKYHLLNGKSYPATDPITTASGHRLLVRYINAGLQHHSMGVLGLQQTVVNEDGNALANPRHMVAESIAPGESTDNLITIPTTTGLSTKYPVYDASLSLNNTTGTGASAGLGGILAVIDAASTASLTDTVGPVTSALALDTVTGALTATMSDATTGGNGVAAAEYFLDTVGATGTGTTMTGTGVDPANVSATVSIGSLPSGDHAIYARGQDNLGHWGAITSTIFTIDKVGPATTGIVLTPPAVNATTASALSATADDRFTGAANIQAAEYFIGAVGAPGTGTPMVLSTTAAPVSSLSATIAAGQTPGVHTISVRSQDALGNWGAFSSVSLTVDNGGPVTSGLSVNPDPNNGTQGINSTNPSVVVAGTFDAAHGIVTTGELFIDAIGPNGNGVPMVPTDGVFDTAHEAAYVDIPLFTINQLAGGDHPIYVHGKDSLGNWGATSTVVLHIVKPGPATSGVTLTPSVSSTVPVGITAEASTIGISTRNVAGGEYFIDTLGLTGTGSPMTVAIPGITATMNGTIPSVTVAGLSVGTHTVYVRARDSVGNWGTTDTAVLTIERTAPTFTSFALSPNPINQGVASVGLTVTGAADIGSGVSGAEFWVGATDVTPGTGTAFILPSTTVPTGSLAAGTYTVGVRIQDNAGNWSATQHQTLTVNAVAPPPDTTPPTFTGITLTPATITYATATVGLTVNGATDNPGGTGVAGGEFWFGATDIPVGMGTAFAGTSATVPTGSLVPGTYTVRVRIRDGANNWSTGVGGVRTAPLTVNPPDAIFSDGFESATLPGAWTSRSTTNTTLLNTSTLARQVGARGLRARGTAANYVQYDFGTTLNPATRVFDARFSFRPNAKTTTGQDIFAAATNTTYGGTRIFRVRYRRSGVTPQVQIQIGTGNSNTFWKNLVGGSAFNKIEVVWQGYNAAIPGSGRLELLVNGVHAQTLTTTTTGLVSTFRIGSVSNGGGNTTYEYFDVFAAKRTATPYLP